VPGKTDAPNVTPLKLLKVGLTQIPLPDKTSRLSGLAVDAQGRVFVVDVPAQKIYGYDPKTKKASLVTDKIPQPMNLVIGGPNNLLVISYNNSAYSLFPDHPGSIMSAYPQPTAPHPGTQFVLPRDIWRNENDFAKFLTEPRPQEIVSPDGSTAIPLENDFITGKLYYNAKMHELLRAFGLQKVAVGQTAYVCDEMELKTYSTTIADDGSRTTPKLFAEDGGESVAVDKSGNVYIASGNINVYAPDGKLKGTIVVPERPLSLAFAPDGTLYAAAGTSLYRCQPGLNK